jgi:hypothetical protein
MQTLRSGGLPFYTGDKGHNVLVVDRALIHEPGYE